MLGTLLLAGSLVATAAPVGQAAGDRPYLSASVPVPDGCIVLGRAWAGVKVFLVQRRLGTGFENDRYGPATFAAVQKFQRNHHLAVTGRVNRPTWRALDLHHPFCMDRFTVQPKVGKHAETHQRIEAMITWAKLQVGTRYVWGAAGSMGYDCSGLSLQAMYAGGRVLPTGKHRPSPTPRLRDGHGHLRVGLYVEFRSRNVNAAIWSFTVQRVR